MPGQAHATPGIGPAQPVTRALGVTDQTPATALITLALPVITAVTIALAGPITNNAAGLISILGGAGNYLVSGVVTGSGALGKDGGGTATLTSTCTDSERCRPSTYQVVSRSQ